MLSNEVFYNRFGDMGSEPSPNEVEKMVCERQSQNLVGYARLCETRRQAVCIIAKNELVTPTMNEQGGQKATSYVLYG